MFFLFFLSFVGGEGYPSENGQNNKTAHTLQGYTASRAKMSRMLAKIDPVMVLNRVRQFGGSGL